MTFKEMEKVPVIDVHRQNFISFWPSILFSCKNSCFIAIDAELSGLGPRKKLMVKDLQQRYQAISDVAKTRAVLSIGISCFRYELPSCSGQRAGFTVQTYNITTLCNEDYIVEPAALQFLVDHGFDFNKQYSKGILYRPGTDKETETDSISVRNLFNEILCSGKPVVVHNGLVDMVFLYQHLYAPLPATYAQFVVDLSEMFQGGLFDTKYLAEFMARIPASYLGYVFRWCQRENYSRSQSGEKYITLTFQEYKDQPYVEYHPLPVPREKPVGDSWRKICSLYSAYGHCNNKTCDGTHDMDIILDKDFRQAEQKKRRRNRKRKMRKPLPTGGNGETNSSNGKGNILEGLEPPKKTERKENGDEIADHEAGWKNENLEGAASCMSELVESERMLHGNESKTTRESKVVSPADLDCVEEHRNGTRLSEDIDMEHARPSEDVDMKHVNDSAMPERNPQFEVDEGMNDSNPADKLPINSHNANDEVVVHGKGDRNGLRVSQTNPSSRQHGSHRAGFDAFMTGYALACTINRHGIFPSEVEAEDKLLRSFGMSGEANKLFLSGKDVPMLVKKSSFAKTSQAHREKAKRLENK